MHFNDRPWLFFPLCIWDDKSCLSLYETQAASKGTKWYCNKLLISPIGLRTKLPSSHEGYRLKYSIHIKYTFQKKGQQQTSKSFAGKISWTTDKIKLQMTFWGAYIIVTTKT